MANKNLVVIVTGASSGIGEITAKILVSQGYEVYGTSRKDQTTDNGWKWLKLDINNEESIKKALQTVKNEKGKIDVLVNNAGMGLAGALEDMSMEEVRQQMETNFFGVVAMCKAVLPFMREQKKGKIINISSIGGLIALPYQSMYSASKFALEGVTEALRLEVASFGIRVSMVEPGDIKTSFIDNRVHSNIKDNSAYKDVCERTMKLYEKGEKSGASPIKVAKKVLKIIKKKNPKLRFLVGKFIEKLGVYLKKRLPQKWWEAMFKSTYKL